MKKNLNYSFTSLIIGLFSCIFTFSQHEDSENSNHYFFKQNKGQWNDIVQFKADLPDGAMFLEKQGITYHFEDKTYLRESHASKEPIEKPKSKKGHVVRVKFKGANENPSVFSDRKSPHYENYFIGNDQSKWASEVRVFNEVTYKGVYTNIDFKIYESQTNMKYDFIIAPGGDHRDIELQYEGADDLYIENGILYVKTTITDIVENKPVAYQLINDNLVQVTCNFQLKKNTLKFDFPNGYDKTKELIIDPVLVFSTYSGATSDNFGFTATYDNLGFTYGGGVIFGTNYPTTTGAYDIAFNGGSAGGNGNPITSPADIAITKFSANGTSLIYSTFLGGSEDEAPHSIVTNNAGELFVLGTTGSPNFPTSTGGYDTSFNGGTFFNTGSGVDYSSGCDIIVTKFNASGTAILGSTFIGGSGNDGLNNVPGLLHNFGDEYRGEIIIDGLNNCLVTSVTNSTNFPSVSGLTYRGGASDGVVFKFNSNLTSLLWSTHIGGSGADAAYGVQQDAAGNTFVAGGTGSSNLVLSQNSSFGGIDGFLAKYSPTNTLLTSRYIGTSAYDQCYFVQIDVTDSVYTFGQSLGSMTVTPGKYSNPGSHQFIQKYNNTLTTLNFSTTFGTSISTVNISPSAFLVNDCGLIYISGWGGSVNSTLGGGTTSGLTTTSGAHQVTTDGTDFYLMVLDKNANGLNYATFFGGAGSNEHVDGGTSRFDKKGNVYQAVCAGCSGSFPTTTGAWATTNGSTNCNLAVFKFNISEIQSIPSTPSFTICYPNAAVFNNSSRNGNSYLWDFGDGNTSTAFAPSHFYGAAGTYTVKLLVYDSTNCIKPDSSNMTITVFDPSASTASPDTIICPNTSVQISASGGSSYLWSPSASLNNDTLPNPIATPTSPTKYRVIVSSTCGIDTSYVNINFHPITTTIINDTTICLGDTTQLSISGGATYDWSPTGRIINPTTPTPSIFPTTSTNYIVNIVTPDGCNTTDSVQITVIDIPTPFLHNDDSICFGDQITLTASGADSYLWSPSASLSASTGTTVIAKPTITTEYFVVFSNQCATLRDSVIISVIVPEASSSPDDTICFNEPVTIWASGGVSYSWSPSSFVVSPTKDTTEVNPSNSTIFRVIVTDVTGCTDTAFTSISFSKIPTINAGIDQIINFGETAILNATSSAGLFSWTPNTSLASTINKSTTAQPNNTDFYIANLLDTFGCKVSDTVLISVNGSLYIPNSFSPNGDGINEVFSIFSEDILDFEIIIFNRWGEILYQSKDITKNWDGTFKGEACQIDTYVWRIVYSDVNTTKKEVLGHVNLIR